MFRAGKGRKVRGIALAGGAAMIFVLAAAPASARPGHVPAHHARAHRCGHKIS